MCVIGMTVVMVICGGCSSSENSACLTCKALVYKKSCSKVAVMQMIGCSGSEWLLVVVSGCSGSGWL